jgi:hypothetical protein
MIPTLSVPVYDFILPSTGKTIKARPFLVKEEKLLLMAAQSKDPSDIINATKKIVSDCIEDDININELSFFDIDYLFIALRSKSIGENIELEFQCNQEVEGKKCGSIFPVTLDISVIGVSKDEDLKDEIWLTPTTGVKMKYPKYSDVKKVMADETILDKRVRVIQASINYLFDDKSTYPINEMEQEKIEEFMGNLTQAQLTKLGNWVDNFPEIFVEAEAVCPTCKFNHQIKYKDLSSFFF